MEKCGHPCENYPECSCVPDIEKHYQNAEEEDRSFTEYSRICIGCGGEITESYSQCECEEE